MSISASSVTLAAWSRSSVKSDAGGSPGKGIGAPSRAGGSGSGCSAFGLPVGSTAAMSLGHQFLFPHRSVWKVWEAAALPCRCRRWWSVSLNPVSMASKTRHPSVDY